MIHLGFIIKFLVVFWSKLFKGTTNLFKVNKNLDIDLL